MKRIGLYAGSFDPVTVGHMDIIRRAAALFDEVIVAVAVNIQKQGWLKAEERLRLLELACADLDNVRVAHFEGLTADFAKKSGAGFLVRGLRGEQDCGSEQTLAEINRVIDPELETVFLMARPEYQAVSSSAVREMAAFGAPWQRLVPEGLAQEISAMRAQRINNA